MIKKSIAVLIGLTAIVSACVSEKPSPVRYNQKEIHKLEQSNKYDLLIKYYEETTDVPEIERLDKLSIIYTYKVPDFGKAIVLNEKLIDKTDKNTSVYHQAALRLIYIYKKLGDIPKVNFYQNSMRGRHRLSARIAEETYNKKSKETGIDYYGVLAALVQLNNYIILLDMNDASSKLFGQYIDALNAMSKQRVLGDIDSLILSTYFRSIQNFRTGAAQAGLVQAETLLTSIANKETLCKQEKRKLKELKSLNKTDSTQKLFLKVLGALEGDTVAMASLAAVGEIATAGGFIIRPVYQQAQLYRLKFTSKYAKGLNRYLNLSEQVELFIWMAKAYKTQHQIENAIIWYQAALKTLETFRNTLVLEQHRIGYFQNMDDIYADLIALLFESGRDEEAFMASERSRSRALLDLISSKSLILSKEERQEYEDAIIYDAEVASILEDKQLSNEALDTFERRKRNIVPQATQKNDGRRPSGVVGKVKQLVSGDLISINELKSLLGPDNVLVEIFYTPDKAYLFWVNNHGVKARSLSISGDELEKITTRYLRAIGMGEYDKSGAKKLYDTIIAPIYDKVAKKHVIFVPYGILHNLPLSTLHDGQSYVVSRITTSYSYSASLLRHSRGRKNDRGIPLVLGDPAVHGVPSLPYAKKEADLVASRLPGSELYLGTKATETRFKRRAGSSRIIHVASHAYFDTKHPMQSSIVLSKDEHNDGFLTAGELFGIDLNKTDLFVLNACETGLGRVSTGDEFMGLTRGILYSGATAIVSTLWKIDDQASAEIMNSFYENLGNMGYAKALQMAQNKIASNYPPYYWGAYKITGAWD